MFDNLSSKLSDAFRHLQGTAKITEKNIESALQEVRMALLGADVNFKVVGEFTASVKDKALGAKIVSGINPRQKFIKIVQDELAVVMGGQSKEIDLERPGPIAIVIVGINGQGKTTFAGKLAKHLYHKKGQRVLLVPADTYRPAAKEQLATLASGAGVDCFDSDLSNSPCKIISKAMDQARELRKDVAIIDTAGRLQVDESLMDELRQIDRLIGKWSSEVLIVADAMTGQEAVNVASKFNDSINLTGVVLSKMDSDARGGAALSIRHVTGLPIRYISVGEKLDDLELFHPDRISSRILDKGDVASLVEKAEEAIEEQDANSMLKRLQTGKLSVDDLLKQLDMLGKLGGMSSMLSMLPGMGGMLRKMGDLSAAEGEMAKVRIIASSMTKEERSDYKIVKSSRIRRIAGGSGVSEQGVHQFLNKLRQVEGVMGQVMQGNMGKMLRSGDPNVLQGKSRAQKKNKGPWGKGFF